MYNRYKGFFYTIKALVVMSEDTILLISKIQAKHPGCLVILSTSANCGACITLRTTGFYENINTNLDLGEDGKIVHDIVAGFVPLGKATIFDLDGVFPSFKYMTVDTYNEAVKSGLDYKSVVSRVCFYNRVYNPATGRLEEDGKYRGMYTPQSVQQFCDDSALELERRRKHVLKPEVQPGKIKRAVMLYDKK